MAFKLRVGALNMPQGGDTIYVYETGTSVTVSPIYSPDSTGATLSNPFTIPAEGFYGFEPPNNNRVDVWWEEGGRYIMTDVNVRDIYLDNGDPLPQYIQHGEAVDYYDFNLAVDDPVARDGRLYWNDDDKTLNMMSNSCVLQIGQETWMRARNTTGNTITNGTPVSIIGSSGNQFLISPTNANDSISAKKFIGLVTEDIIHNDVGFVTINGAVRNLDTSAYSAEGVTLWVDPNNIGGLTETEPTTGYKICIGLVKYIHNTQGELCTNPVKMPRLTDLSGIVEGDDVVIQSNDDLILRAIGDRVLLDAQGTNGYTESLRPLKIPTYTNASLPDPSLYSIGTVVYNSSTEQLTINNGSEWLDNVETRFVRDKFVAATGGQATFTTSETYSPNTYSIIVMVDGVVQDTDNYFETNNRTIAFTENVPGGSSVGIIYLADLIIPEQSTDFVNYTNSGTGAVTQTVTNYLDQIGFITSYGADPSGINNAAININTTQQNHDHIFIPSGTFSILTDLTIDSNVTILGGGIVDIASDVTLTINGNFDSYLGEVFVGDGNLVINGSVKLFSLKSVTDLRDYIGYDGARVEINGKIRTWKTDNAPYSDDGDTIIVPTLGDGSGAWVLIVNEYITDLDLGTASTADVTTSATDTTAGRVLKVGDYQGLLSENYQDSPLAPLLTAADPSDIAYSGCTLFGSLSDTYKWIGGVLAPNGKIYGIPSNSTQVLEIDPATQTTTLFGSLSGTGKWIGGVLAPNGKIYGIPRNSTQVLEIDPATQTTTLFGSLSGTDKWFGGVLAPNGKIYGIPRNSTQVLEIDPATQTTTLFGSLSDTDKWVGGVLAPNGKIYGIPYNSTQVLEIDGVSNGKHWWALSKYTNKL
jgi:hypothetical protein